MKRNLNLVFFHSIQKTSFLRDREKLKRFISHLFLKEKKKLKEIHYIFCSDDYLLAINQEHLQHDFLTDIISFDLSEKDGVIGEIYISVNRLKENAKSFKVSQTNEALRLIFHGALHLCGYKDKNKKDKLLMTSKEDFYLELFSSF